MTTTQPDPADYWTGPAVWLFDPLGYAEGAVMFIGPTLWPAGIDPGATQTAMAVYGPAGGQMNVPAVVEGQPGPAPTLRNVNQTQVAYGDALPSPAASFTQVLPGVYDLNIALNSGEPGDAGDIEIHQASDLSGTLVDKYTIAWNASTTEFNPKAFPVTAWYNVAAIAATGTNGGQTRSISNITIPAQPNAYIPIIFADATVTGTANTQVDLVARLGGSINTQGGSQIARGRGQVGTVIGANPWTTAIIPNFPSLLTGGYGQVAANTAATIYLNTEQQASTTDLYSTGAASFTVGVCQIP